MPRKRNLLPPYITQGVLYCVGCEHDEQDTHICDTCPNKHTRIVEKEFEDTYIPPTAMKRAAP